MAGTSMSFRIKMIALAFLAVTGWGGFAYLSWAEAWVEQELQSHLDELMSEQTDAVSFTKDS